MSKEMNKEVMKAEIEKASFFIKNSKQILLQNHWNILHFPGINFPATYIIQYIHVRHFANPEPKRFIREI